MVWSVGAEGTVVPPTIAVAVRMLSALTWESIVNIGPTVTVFVSATLSVVLR
jgi:phospholipid N-methyltransferase